MDKEKKLKNIHNDVYSNIKPSDELIKRTSQLMKEELKEEKKIETKKRKIYYKPITAFACSIAILVGVGIYNNQYKGEFHPPREEINDGEWQESPSNEMLPDESMDKIAVNISGKVEEISEDGRKIKIGGKWIIVDENTEFSTNFDGEEVSREFKIGNYVEGFTIDDVNSSEVTAEIIYSND